MSMTQIEGIPSRDSVKPGMAHFSGTGPSATTCGGCAFLTPTQGRVPRFRCAKFTMLMGQEGNCIRREFYSCKYFEPNQQR